MTRARRVPILLHLCLAVLIALVSAPAVGQTAPPAEKQGAAAAQVTKPTAAAPTAATPQKPAETTPGQKPADPKAEQKPADPKAEQKPADPKAEQKPADPTGQKPADTAKPATPPQSPEAKALRDAQQLTDIDKQIEAFQKVIADFPKTSAANSAENMILSAYSRKTTADIKALQEHAKKWVDGAATPSDKISRAGQTASTLAGAGVLLDDAEQYAKTNLGGFTDEKAWIAAQKKSAEDAAAEALKKDPTAKPRPEVSDVDWSTRFASMRQTSTMTLAQIYEKKGKAADAEKAYRDAYAMNPKAGGAAALKLAEFAKAAGYPYEQLEYLTIATLAGRVTATSRADLEAVYKKTYGGTVADLDEMLDERYEKDATKVEPKPYVATKARTDRVVLAELFTGAGCPPCVAADLAWEGALERYSPKELAVLIYHLHIPRPDPMTNPSTVTRKEFYDVPGTPTYFVDGGSQKVGGGGAANAEKLYKDTVEPAVDKRLDVKPAAKIALKASMAGDRVDVTADVKNAAKPDQKLRLHIALVEEIVHYTGENGVRFHPMVVRSLASTEKNMLGFALTGGKRANVTYTFDVAKAVSEAKTHLDEMEGGSSTRFGKFQFIERKSDINRSNLRIVAWVQDEKTKDVLQTVTFDLAPAVPAGKVH
jgi:tetratricopeptide (TPR) repeat protein